MHEVYNTPLANLSPHRMSLFFILMALGHMVDVTRPAEPIKAEKYHSLARASLHEMAIPDEADLCLVQVLVGSFCIL